MNESIPARDLPLAAPSDGDTSVTVKSTGEVRRTAAGGMVDNLAPAFLKTTSDIINGLPVPLIRNVDRSKHTSLREGTLADDLTAAAAELVDAMASAGYGHLTLGVGEHRFGSVLQLPAGIIISGQGCQPYTTANNTAPQRGKGTWLHFDHAGVGIRFQGATAASAGSVIRGLGTRRTHAAPGGGWTPTVYEYDFVVQGVDTSIDDVVMLNAYKGVHVISSGYGRLWTNRLRGQCFAEALNLEESFDTCRIRDSHFWPFWSQHSAVVAWQKANTKVVRIARCDNSQISGLFSIYSARGLEIYATGSGTAYRLRLTDVELDECDRSMYVDAASDGASVWASNFAGFGQGANATCRGVEIDGTNGRYELANGDFANLALDGIRVDGTGNSVRLLNTRVRSWNMSNTGAAAYECAAGSQIEAGDRFVATDGGSGPIFGATADVYKGLLGTGLASGTTNGSGDLAVTHGLGATPTGVFLSGIGTGSLQITCQAVSSTTFTIRVMDAAGTPVAAQPVNVLWEARKA